MACFTNHAIGLVVLQLLLTPLRPNIDAQGTDLGLFNPPVAGRIASC